MCRHTRYELRQNGIAKCLNCGAFLSVVIHRVRGIKIVSIKEVER